MIINVKTFSIEIDDRYEDDFVDEVERLCKEYAVGLDRYYFRYEVEK